MTPTKDVTALRDRLTTLSTFEGFPKEAIPNLFRRFYRAQTAVERGIAGTGLGLYMVKEGLESYGGSIEVESQEGKGTKFTVLLPIASTQLLQEHTG